MFGIGRDTQTDGQCPFQRSPFIGRAKRRRDARDKIILITSPAGKEHVAVVAFGYRQRGSESKVRKSWKGRRQKPNHNAESDNCHRTAKMALPIKSLQLVASPSSES